MSEEKTKEEPKEKFFEIICKGVWFDVVMPSKTSTLAEDKTAIKEISEKLNDGVKFVRASQENRKTEEKPKVCPKCGSALKTSRNGRDYCYACWKEKKSENGEWEERTR